VAVPRLEAAVGVRAVQALLRAMLMVAQEQPDRPLVAVAVAVAVPAALVVVLEPLGLGVLVVWLCGSINRWQFILSSMAVS